MAEGGGLLNRYRINSPIVGSNPIPSANFLLQTRKAPPTAAEFFVYSKGFGQTKRTSETGKAAIFGL